MTNSLLVTKYIRDILAQDTALMKMIPKKQLIAVDAKLSTAFPFIVIERTGLVDKLSKDGIYEDTISVRIYVVDNNYVNSIEIANETRNWLEGHKFKDEKINIKRMILVGSFEYYERDAFVQVLDFNITVN